MPIWLATAPVGSCGCLHPWKRSQDPACRRTRFGRGSRPGAVVLTHGHFDHAGSAGALADAWGVRIYAHPLEIPYLTGQCQYPPFDLSRSGFFTRIARFFPTSTVNLGKRVYPLEPKHAIPGLPDWEIIETPGHTPGHMAFFRCRDAVLPLVEQPTSWQIWPSIFVRPNGSRGNKNSPPSPRGEDSILVFVNAGRWRGSCA
jgi:hypothetical protein